MDVNQVKKDSLKLMEESKAAYLTTIDSNGAPITRAMLNLRNKEQFPEFTSFYKKQENQFRIYISTNTSSSKVTQIKENPIINVYFCDTDDFKGVMFGGKVEIIEAKKLKHELWLDWWTRYYPEGVEDPDYTLLCLNPKNLRYYYRLNQVNLEL